MPLTPDAVECNLLSSIGSINDVGLIVEKGIVPESFLVYGPVFEYVVSYTREYGGDLPSFQDLEALFTGTESPIEFLEPGNLEFYLDELVRQDMVRKMSAMVKTRFGDKGIDLIADPFKVATGLEEDLRKLGYRENHNNVAYFDRDAIVRLAHLEANVAAAQAGQVIGIQTGLRVFDDSLQGWKPGEAAMIIGPTTIGKSWLLMYFGCLAYANGNRVLYLSPEMSWEECGLRFDVVLANQYQRHISHTALSNGGMVDIEKYREWLLQLSVRDDFICIDSVDADGFTLHGILAMAAKYEPDILLIDGIDRISDAHSPAGWELIKAAAKGLKDYAQLTKSVVIWTGQVDRAGMRMSEAVSLGHSAYGKAAEEFANRIITLGPDPSNPLRRTFKVPKNRSGRAWNTRQYLAFDVDQGHIEQIKVEAPDEFEGDMIEI